MINIVFMKQFALRIMKPSVLILTLTLQSTTFNFSIAIARSDNKFVTIMQLIQIMMVFDITVRIFSD